MIQFYSKPLIFYDKVALKKQLVWVKLPHIVEAACEESELHSEAKESGLVAKLRCALHCHRVCVFRLSYVFIFISVLA